MAIVKIQNDGGTTLREYFIDSRYISALEKNIEAIQFLVNKKIVADIEEQQTKDRESLSQ